ncbi:MAG: aldo/keto reductase, partial [Myxococcota bacterium]
MTIFPLAFGAGHIGDTEQDDQAIGQLLNQAVDLGINLFDTALSYGLSEDRIRRHLGPRRHEVLLSTKVG